MVDYSKVVCTQENSFISSYNLFPLNMSRKYLKKLWMCKAIWNMSDKANDMIENRWIIMVTEPIREDLATVRNKGKN